MCQALSQVGAGNTTVNKIQPSLLLCSHGAQFLVGGAVFVTMRGMARHQHLLFSLSSSGRIVGLFFPALLDSGMDN